MLLNQFALVVQRSLHMWAHYFRTNNDTADFAGIFRNFGDKDLNSNTFDETFNIHNGLEIFEFAIEGITLTSDVIVEISFIQTNFFQQQLSMCLYRVRVALTFVVCVHLCRV